MAGRHKLGTDGHYRDSSGYILCPHDKRPWRCRECAGAGVCGHNKLRSRCATCCGHEVCAHGVRRHACGLCGGNGVYRKHLNSVKRRGKVNELTEPRYRWLITQDCAYCGAPSGGVDRAKNTHGYTTFNSVPCCSRCNYAKHTVDAPEFFAHIHRIIAHNSTYEAFKQRWIETRTTGPDLVGTSDSLNSSHSSTTAGTTVCTESGGN